MITKFSTTEVMDSFSFVASSRISCMISGERVRAIRTLRGLPDGGLAMRESYDANYFNVHLIFQVAIKGKFGAG